MKSNYENSMYEFYTQPDNFETMLHVAEQAQWVSKQVINDFYSETAKKLEEKLKEKSDSWCVKVSDDWKHRYVKIMTYKQEWCLGGTYPMLSVAIENLHLNVHPFIGIHIDYDRKEIDGSELKNKIKALEKLKDGYNADSSVYWAIWKYLEIDHGNTESLLQLLPTNREISIENVIGEFDDLLDLAEEEITKILKIKA